jgi:hypothetical protein
VDKFELTEADRERRRRGDEYREAAALRTMGLRPTPGSFDPLEMERDALPAIALAIERKAAKHYQPAPHLLVYVNFALFRELPLTEEQAIQIVAPWRERFASVWLLWGANAVRCWPNPAKIVARNLPVPT